MAIGGEEACVAGCAQAEPTVEIATAAMSVNVFINLRSGSPIRGPHLQANEIAVFSMAFLTAWSAAAQRWDWRRRYSPAGNPESVRRRSRSTRCHRAADRTSSF